MKMIIVDDEILQIETMEEYLGELAPDAEIHYFLHPQEALNYLQDNSADIAFLDIKMPGTLDGLGLAKEMKSIIPDIKIIFCTGYSEYALDAFRLHADGYLCKPIMKDRLREELEYLTSSAKNNDAGKPFIHTFGNFDLFVGDAPVVFSRTKSKEALAWITDRKGAWVTSNELMSGIWEDYNLNTPTNKYASLLIKEMIRDLESYGVSYIVEHKRGKIRLCVNEVRCDYLEMLSGKTDSGFKGEYMTQYSWGETTLSNLLKTTYL